MVDVQDAWDLEVGSVVKELGALQEPLGTRVRLQHWKGCFQH